jgi:nucleolar complex protein 2
VVAFDKLLLLAYQKTPEVLSHHVPIHTKLGKPHLSNQKDKGQKDKVGAIVPLLKSLFHSTLILLPNLSSPPTTLLVLKQTEKLVAYITSFRKMIKQLIVAILDIWARSVRTGDDDEEEDLKRVEESDAVKIAAFLWVRQVMLVGDSALKEMVLKVPTTLIILPLASLTRGR